MPLSGDLEDEAAKSGAGRLAAIVRLRTDPEAVLDSVPPGVTVRRVLPMSKALAVEAEIDALRALARMPEVIAVEPDRKVSTT